MLRSTLLLSLTAASFGLLPACTSSDVSDELAGETAADDISTDGKADSAVDGSYTYFTVKSDQRRCAAPNCGGFFLERLNRTTTVCHDNHSAARCYTPELDWSESGLGAGQQDKLLGMATKSAGNGGVYGIVRGRFAKTNSTPLPQLGRFVITEAWIAEGENPADGVFARVKDAGVRCIASPCASLIEKGLNTSRSAMIAGVDYEPAGLTDTQTEGFGSATFEQSGIILAGDRYTIHEGGRTAKGRTATNAYHRLAEPAATACFVGGCSSQVCSEQEGVITTCEFRPEYACYATATCERQAGGECGWTETAELSSCLAN